MIAHYAHTVPITEVKNQNAERMPLVLKQKKKKEKNTLQYVSLWQDCSIK